MPPYSPSSVLPSDGQGESPFSSPVPPPTSPVPPPSLSVHDVDDRFNPIGLPTFWEDIEEVRGLSDDGVRQEEESEDTLDLEEDDVKVFDYANPSLEVGQSFPTRDAFKHAVYHYCLQNRIITRTIRSDSRRVTIACVVDNCPWRVHGFVRGGSFQMVIHEYNSAHHCSGVIPHNKSMGTSKWVASICESWLRRNAYTPTREIQHRIHDVYGIPISYGKAIRGRKVAMDIIDGTSKEMFQMFPRFAAEILQTNPGSIVDLVVDTDCRFKRFFFSLKGCIDGFLEGCRPFLGLDGAHMSSRYKGVLLAATAVDADNKIFPVAFGMVECESLSSWSWFCKHLHEAVGIRPGLTFISDGHLGIRGALRTYFPECERRTCTFHMAKNLMKSNKGSGLEYFFHKSAATFCSIEKAELLNQVRNISENAYNWIITKTDLWARSDFQTDSKVEYKVSNICESLNKVLLKIRQTPQLKCALSIVDYCMMICNSRSKSQIHNTHTLCDRARLHISRSLTEVGHLKAVQSSTGFGCKVTGERITRQVDTCMQTCSCGEWQVTGLPCRHATCGLVATYGHNTLWEYNVSHYYRVECLRSTYMYGIEAIRDRRMWPLVPDMIDVLPPSYGRRAGRPKVKRMRAAREPPPLRKRSIARCSRCGVSGHNRTSCTQLPQPGLFINEPNEDIRNRKRKKVQTGNEKGKGKEKVSDPASVDIMFRTPPRNTTGAGTSRVWESTAHNSGTTIEHAHLLPNDLLREFDDAE